MCIRDSLRTVHELVAGVDDALGRAIEGGEGVGEEVEVAFVTFGALVDDLEGSARNHIFEWERDVLP